MVGIVSYGTYLPKYRLSLAEIANVWKKSPGEIIKSLGVSEKTVPSIDEDAVTIAIEAATQALKIFPQKRNNIGALFIGSESHPYAVNPSSSIVGEFLDIGHNYFSADLEFACKAGSAAIQIIASLISAKQINYGLAIGSDTAQSKPRNALEYTSASAGAAFLLGSSKVIASLEAYASYSSDTPDFWRRDGSKYPSHAGRFTGEPAYFSHVINSSKLLFQKINLKASDIDYCVFHMPNGKFPRDVASRLGFTEAQLAPSLTVNHIGNPYSASSLMGLAAVLDIAKPHQRIFMVSYGSGAGSDAFLWETTPNILAIQKDKTKNHDLVLDQIKNKTYINYLDYLKQTHKL